MRGSGLSALAASEIRPAAVRLYARSVEIEIEVEDMMADGDHMTTEELWRGRTACDVGQALSDELQEPAY